MSAIVDGELYLRREEAAKRHGCTVAWINYLLFTRQLLQHEYRGEIVVLATDVDRAPSPPPPLPTSKGGR